MQKTLLPCFTGHMAGDHLDNIHIIAITTRENIYSQLNNQVD